MIDRAPVTVAYRGNRVCRPRRIVRNMTQGVRGSRLPCSIEGCDAPARAYGWCGRHHQRWAKYGDPLTLLRPQRRPVVECAAEGCRVHALVKGWCGPHYARVLKTGSPAPFVPLTRLERFEAYVVRGPGCWGWSGPKNSQGYAVLAHRAEGEVLAHRFSFELAGGIIPEGFVLDHECHNLDLACLLGRKCPHRACTNPSDLEPVTLAENVRRSAKHRRSARGK